MCIAFQITCRCNCLGRSVISPGIRTFNYEYLLTLLKFLPQTDAKFIPANGRNELWWDTETFFDPAGAISRLMVRTPTD